MNEHASRLSLGPRFTASTHSEEDLISLLQKGNRPIADISFAEKGSHASVVGSIRLGNLLLGEAAGDAAITKTKIEHEPSFVIPFFGGGRLLEGSQSILLPPRRNIIRYAYARPLELHTSSIQLVSIRPSLAELKAAILQLSGNAALADRLTTGHTSVHSGQFGELNYHDQLVNLLSIVSNARGDRDYLERIGIADVLTRLLAEFVVAEAGHAAAGVPLARLPRSTRAVDLICDHIERNIGTPLTIPRMEKLTGMTGRALNYAFHARFGCSPQEWQRNHLLDVARGRLLDPSQTGSIKSIAYELGFSSSSSFASFYRRRFGELPSGTLARAVPGGRDMAFARGEDLT